MSDALPTGRPPRPPSLPSSLRGQVLGVVDEIPLIHGSARLLAQGAQFPLGPWKRSRSRRRLEEVCRVIPAVLAREGLRSSKGSGEDLKVISAAWSGTGVAVAKLGPPSGSSALIVKLPPKGRGVGLKKAAEVLQELRADQRLEEFIRLVPTPLGYGHVGGQAYAVERALPGVAADIHSRRPEARATLLCSAAAAIGELHDRTGREVTVDSATLAEWTDGPAELLARVSGDGRRVAAVTEVIHRGLAGRCVVVSWIHGDYWPGNLLVADDAVVVGIVDFEWASPDQLPQHDLLHLLVYARMLRDGVEVGSVVRALLEGARLDQAEQRVLGGKAFRPEEAPADRAMLLLFWLRHVSLSLSQSPHYARNWVWMARNVSRVLTASSP